MTATSDEIRGDWNNLKGTHYHLLYALWLLLRNEAANVYFYEGNDLLARLALPSPTPPPHPALLKETDDAPAIALYAERATTDIWIQLKSTKSSWSCSRLFDENLLTNFVCNGFQSEARKRAWRASLITQGRIKHGEVKDFVISPDKHLILNAKLNQILQTARARLQKEGRSASETNLPNLRRIALEILSQLSDAEPIALETLKSDVNAELTRAYPDQEVVRQLEDLLIGAFIRDASLGPLPARIYDSDWINLAAGKPVVNRGMFDEDPVGACNIAVHAFALEIGFEPERFAIRNRLQNALEQFTASDKTLFVITGLSGSGKSWSCADWALRSLDEELRLLIPGHDMDHHKSLGELVQKRLRPSTSAFWPPEQFLKRLATASELDCRKPFTAIIDNLIPVGDLNVYRRDLARIVAECRSRGFKIVLTCQKQLWELHHLGTEIPSNDVFDLSSEKSGSEKESQSTSEQLVSSSKGQLHSFMLADFSPEEQRAALSKRLSPDRADQVANHFRLPGFTLLRSPYLLSRYLEWHDKELRGSGEPPPFHVDELLDWYVKSLIEKAATELSCSSADIEPAFGELVERLWSDRGEGFPLGNAVGCLGDAFPERGSELLLAFRRVGLLTSSGPIRLADALIADRLFAMRIQRQLQSGATDIFDHLNPEADSGVVTALIRDVASDSIFLSEHFLARNSGWASAVALGLAQGSPNDWRALALLTSLLSYEEDHVLEAGYSGLGQIGARGQRAWKWLAELYLGDHAKTWYRGSRALAEAIEYIPNNVEAAIRTRLTRLLHIEPFSTDRDRRRSWLLHGSLDPLRGVTHQSSAAAAQRIVNRYCSLADQGQDWSFTNDLDQIRGRIALFGPSSHLTILLAELNSDSAETRYRVTYALRIVAAERPDLVKNSLLSRIPKEWNFQVLARLLLISFHLIASHSEDLLTSIKSCKAGDLNKALMTTGVTLSLLGNLASKHPQAVQELLPERLHKHPAWARAFSTEMLAYAWWRCAETNVAAKQVLQAMSNTEVKGLEKKFIPFALRGSAIALLGLMSVEQGLSAEELTGHQAFYPNQQKQFLYVETVEFFQRNVKTLIQHQDFDRFVDLLLQSVIEEERAQVHPIYPLKEALFRCASMCLELVAQTTAVMDDPLPLLIRLPRDWQSIRAATRLLELGRHDVLVVNFARESYEHTGTTQALEERRRCQAQLALLDHDPRSALNEQRQSVVKSIFIQSEGNSLGVATLAAKQPENLLSYLEDNIQDEHDLPTLYYLVEQALTWPTLLVARLYSRMFNSSPIGRHEAADLCEQILAAVRSIPHSFIQEEYESVYLRIYELLHGNALNPEPVQRPVSNAHNLISQSHKLGIEISAGYQNATREPDPEQHLRSFLYDSRGWLETGFYGLRHNLLLQGTSYMMYFFPAVRLSLVAAGAQLGLEDPAGSVMKARAETARIINDHSYLFHAAGIDEEDNPHAQRALADLQNRATVSPDDERLPDTIGTLLLLMNRFNEAETALKQSLSLPLSRGSMRAHTLKNLACVYARVNDEAGCRAALEESGRIEPLDQKWLSEGPDLEAIRDHSWFKTLTTKVSP